MSDTGSEALFDEYLDTLLRGESPRPEEFLQERGIHSPALLFSLQALYEHRASPHATPISTAPAGGSARLGDFLLLRPLGQGGMGVVWLALQASLGRQVALKVIQPGSAASLAALARFDREARALAKLSHPNVVRIHAVGEERGMRYIAMELVEGQGLDEVIEAARTSGRPIAPARAVRWCAVLASALHAVHTHGAIHRDVKPSNVLVTAEDRPVLLDFGLAREPGIRGVTLTEGFVGSPAYAAPEQIARGGGDVDARTDVYALGMVLYELLTGVSPFGTGLLEQVLHAILTERPAAPQKLVPGIGRDLSTVVMKAIDKDPSRRYQTAHAFEADLTAILELRPISARPPGLWERAGRWSREHRAVSGAVGAGALGVVALAGLAAWNQVQQRRERLAEAVVALDAADQQVREYRDRRVRTRELESQHEHLAGLQGATYFTAEQDRQLDTLGQQIRRLRRENERSLYTTLELADRAEGLGADPERVHHARARAYLERFFEAELSGSVGERERYRELVRSEDPHGTFAASLIGASSVSLITDPPGAVVHLFRRRLASEVAEGAEPRLVPVPWRGAVAEVAPGTWGLVVTSGAGGLVPGDVVLRLAGRPIRGTVFVQDAAQPALAGTTLLTVDGTSVLDVRSAQLAAEPQPGRAHRFELDRDGARAVLEGATLEALGLKLLSPAAIAESGGVPAQVWSGGSLRELVLPEGLLVRPSGAPVLESERSLLGTTPIAEAPLEPGEYIADIRAEGFEPHRVAFQVGRDGPAHLRVQLLREGESPAGFVRITAARAQDGRHPGFWIMQHEVTVRDYFEFLNDPATRSAALASPTPILYPRDGETALGQRDAAGLFTLPAGWSWEWPVLFVSWEDAKAYCRWRTERDHAKGLWRTYDLPTLEEWVDASATFTGARYHFGEVFHPKWVCSCFARTRADPEAVMSFPIDESALGVYDLAGSASEWTSSLWRDGYGYYRYSGGSWGTGDPPHFAIYGGNGLLPDRVAGVVGFRAVCRPDVPEAVSEHQPEPTPASGQP